MTDTPGHVADGYFTHPWFVFKMANSAKIYQIEVRSEDLGNCQNAFDPLTFADNTSVLHNCNHLLLTGYPNIQSYPSPVGGSKQVYFLGGKVGVAGSAADKIATFLFDTHANTVAYARAGNTSDPTTYPIYSCYWHYQSVGTNSNSFARWVLEENEWKIWRKGGRWNDFEAPLTSSFMGRTSVSQTLWQTKDPDCEKPLIRFDPEFMVPMILAKTL